MKRNLKISLTALSLILLFSCGYKHTQVINTVHKDGSFTRKVIVETNTRKFLEPKTYDIPIDDTWKTEITSEVKEGNDTTWTLTAEKDFKSVDELNEDYRYDLGANRVLNRTAGFSRKFKWFTTVFRFNETVGNVLKVSCPLSDFLSEEELKFFYLPDKVKENLKNGSDSLRIRKMADSIDLASEKWIWTCEMREWTGIFYDLFENDPRLKISREEMKLKEPRFVNTLMKGDTVGDLDSAFIAAIGKEFDTLFKPEIDYAVKLLEEKDKSFWSAHNYDMEIRMPGKIIASNGYALTGPDSINVGGILWTVDPGYFLTEPYEMWAESRLNNYFIWIVTALFILFVAIGLTLFRRKTRI